MPLLCCVPKKSKKNKHTLETTLVSLCEYNTPMINAGVTRFSNGFVNINGWDCDVSSSYENNDVILKINIKDKLDSIIIETSEHDDCAVCMNDTNQTVKCCNKHICLKCLKEIKKTCEKEPDIPFCCPLCRRDFDNYVTTYRFDKSFLSKLTDAGENQEQKNEHIKTILI